MRLSSPSPKAIIFLFAFSVIRALSDLIALIGIAGLRDSTREASGLKRTHADMACQQKSDIKKNINICSFITGVSRLYYRYRYNEN